MNELTATELEGALLETLAASDVVDIPAEVVDTVIHMPILSVLKKLAGGVYTVRDHLFRKKILRLISRVAAMPATEREEAIIGFLRLQIIGIDSRNSSCFARTLRRHAQSRRNGQSLCWVAVGQISLLEFWRMNRAVEAIASDEEWPSYGIGALRRAVTYAESFGETHPRK